MLENIIIKLASAESLPEVLPSDPMPLLTRWFEDARNSKAVPNPDAIALATSTPDGHPSVRMVLCRGLDPAGSLVFYTNYHGRKATELESNPRAAVAFHFDHEGRQARAEGFVRRTTDQESDAYFHKRALLSRLGAWGSRQSEKLGSRGELISAVAAAASRMKVSIDALLSGGSGVTVPRPPHWGGYRLWIDRVELWCGGNGRLHDRAAWVRRSPDSELAQTDAGAAPSFSPWESHRLYP